jgi:hypothetical protein
VAVQQRSHPARQGSSRRALPLRIALLAAVLCGLAATPVAWGHGGPSPASAHFLSTVLGITPAVPGLSVSVADRDDRLVLTNDTGKVVVVSGYSLEPYLRFEPHARPAGRGRPEGEARLGVADRRPDVGVARSPHPLDG